MKNKEAFPELVECMGEEYLYWWIKNEEGVILEPWRFVHIICFNDGGEILIQLENGVWRFPGGGKEDEELSCETAYRELMEETGVIPKDIKTIGAFKIKKVTSQERQTYFQLCTFCRFDSQGTRISSVENRDISQIKFVRREVVGSYVNWGRHGQEMIEAMAEYYSSTL